MRLRAFSRRAARARPLGTTATARVGALVPVVCGSPSTAAREADAEQKAATDALPIEYDRSSSHDRSAPTHLFRA